MLFCRLLNFFFSKLICSKNLLRMSNSLDPDQARHLVGPDLGPNCLQRFITLADKELKKDLMHL